MNIINGLKFKINGVIYIITGVWQQGRKKVEVEFSTWNRDEPIECYKMEAKKLESKLNLDNVLGI